MIVQNTAESELDVVIKGTHYHVDALGEIKNVPEAHAVHWKTQIHEFIKILPEEAPVAKAAPVTATTTETPSATDVVLTASDAPVTAAAATPAPTKVESGVAKKTAAKTK